MSHINTIAFLHLCVCVCVRCVRVHVMLFCKWKINLALVCVSALTFCVCVQVWLFLVTLLPEWQTVRSSVCVSPHGLQHREVHWPCSCLISLSHQHTPPDTENFLSPFFTYLETQTLSLFIPLFLTFRVDLCEDNCVSHRAAVASPWCEVQAPRHLSALVFLF